MPLHLRWMLLFEDPINATVALLKTTPRTWLNPGERIAVRRAPLGRGRVSFEVLSQLDAASPTVAANISLDEPHVTAPPPMSITLRVPKPWRMVSVVVNGKAWDQFDADSENVQLPLLGPDGLVVVASYSKPAAHGLKSDDEAHTRTVVSVADYGAIADSEADSCLAFNKSIEAARANNASVLRIPRGTYHFHWDVCTRVDMYVSNTVVTPLPPKPIALWLRGLTGLVIEGEHSLLLMHGLMTPIAIDHSHNVTVKNLAIDFPHPSVIEALVTTVAADSMSLELKVHSSNNVSVSKGKAVFGSFGEGWTLAQPAPLAQEFDPASDITWRRSNPMYGATVTALDDAQSLRLTYKTKQSQMPKAGHHLWFRDGGRPNAGLITQYSSAVTYESVVMHFMSGFGVVAQYTRGLSLLNVSAETAAGSGRHCSCQADLLHFSGCAGLINVTGGRFVGSQDDGVNCHGTHLQIVEQPSERSIVVQFMQHESYGFQAFFAGDTVQFTRSDSLESFGTGVIKSAKMLSTKGCPADPNSVLPCQQALELEDPLVGARLKMDVVENLAYTASLVITGAYFSRIPTRGMLVSTRGSVRISNNTIHTPLRPALHIADDAESWFESGPVADVVFDGNLVIRKHNTSASHARVDSPPVDVAPSNTKNATVHRNLHVTNNELHLHHMSNLSVVAAKSIAGVTLSGNRIYSPGRSLATSEMVSSVNCSGIVIDDNIVITSTTTLPVKSDDVATATTSRVIHAGGVVTADVTAFGAEGDGTTDDATAIEKALAAVSTQGGTIFFPPGQYALSRAIVLSGTGIALVGAGMHRPLGAAAGSCGGSALVSLTANSTLVVFQNCVGCRLEHMAMNHAAAGDEPPLSEQQLAQHCGTHARHAASAVARRPRGSNRVPAPAMESTTRRIVPTSGAAVTIRGSFATTLSDLWIEGVFAHIAASEMANTITILDSQFISAFGPCSICAAGGIGPPVGLPSANFNGTRVDILQISRLTTNNDAAANSSVVWIDIGAGVNTVRLDNVGLINGGTGVRMSSPADDPPGEYPGRPLFLLANDLEIDFPSGNAIELNRGEEVQISNGYIQGAGSNVLVDRRANDSSLGVGLLIGENFNSETMMTNTRVFGHALSGVVLAGGAHCTLSNNIVGACSHAEPGKNSGILVRAGVSDFIIQGNHIGDVFRGENTSSTKYGVEVEAGAGDRYVIASNTVVGNVAGGVSDEGSGAHKSVTGNVG